MRPVDPETATLLEKLDRVPDLLGPAAQGVQPDRHQLQGLGLLQDRQPLGFEPIGLREEGVERVEVRVEERVEV